MTNRRIKLIALDLDQTTLRTDKSLSVRNETAIRNALAAGICVAVASGRAFSSLPAQVRSIPGIEYAVTSNGAALYYIPEGRRCHQKLLLPELARELLRLVPEDLPLEAFIDGRPYAAAFYVEDPGRFGLSGAGTAYIRSTRTAVADIRSFLLRHRHELDAVDVIVRGEEEKQRLRQILSEKIPQLYITSSAPQLLELSCAKGGKRCGLEWLGEHLHIRPEEMAAFGDGENDCDMLRYAGLGVAVANAHPSLKAAADVVTLSNDEDGVGAVIEKILENLV